MYSMPFWNKNRTQTHPTYFRHKTAKLILIRMHKNGYSLSELFWRLFHCFDTVGSNFSYQKGLEIIFTLVFILLFLVCLITIIKPFLLKAGFSSRLHQTGNVKQLVTDPLPSALHQMRVFQEVNMNRSSVSQWVWHVRELSLFDGHGNFIDWWTDWLIDGEIAFYAYWQYFRHVMANHWWQVQVKYRLQWCNFSKIEKKFEWEKSKLYVLPDLPKNVKNLHDFIVHSLHISANIVDIVWMRGKLMENSTSIIMLQIFTCCECVKAPSKTTV